MAPRSIDGPAHDWLEMTDMAQLTRLSEKTIERLIAAGVFPPARQVTDRIRLWHWTDYLYWSLKVQIFGAPGDDGESTPLPADKPGKKI